MNLKDFSEPELQTMVTFTKMLANEMRQELATEFNYDARLSAPDSEPDLEQARQQALDLIEARKKGRSGRVLFDSTAEDRETRTRIREWFRKTNHKNSQKQK